MSDTKKVKLSISLTTAGFVLFCIFTILKLTSYIAWSWWWVTAPLWVPFALVILLVACAVGFAIFIAIVAAVFSAGVDNVAKKKGK